MKMKYLIAAAAWLVLGVIYVTLVAWFKPRLLVGDNKEFRYDLASTLIILWFGSLLYQLAKRSLTWPARFVLSKRGNR